MSEQRSTAESPYTLLSICMVGLIVGSCVGVAHLRIFGEPLSALGFVPLGATLGILFWMFLVSAIYRRRWRRQRNRIQRRAMGIRSPWGERRTEPAKPYADRLASFLTHSAHDQTATPPAPMKSRMAFWSIFDLPCEPTDAKPTWFLRRMLDRIHRAVHG